MLYFSKSKYCGLGQCPKIAWLQKFKPEEFKPEEMYVEGGVASRLAAGNEVGDLAMGIFGDYVEATAYKGEKIDLPKMIDNTRIEMSKETPVICEASFEYEGLYCAVDILRRENDGWAIYEVKSSTHDDKEVYYADVSYQKYVLEHCGVKVTGTYLICLNGEYVFDLYRLSFDKKLAYYKAGCAFFEALEQSGYISNDKQKRQIDFALHDRSTYIAKESIGLFLNGLSFPLYFFDFETVQPVIPKYIGTKPYAQIPFQYSLHYIERDGGVPFAH